MTAPRPDATSSGAEVWDLDAAAGPVLRSTWTKASRAVERASRLAESAAQRAAEAVVEQVEKRECQRLDAERERARAARLGETQTEYAQLVKEFRTAGFGVRTATKSTNGRRDCYITLRRWTSPQASDPDTIGRLVVIGDTSAPHFLNWAVETLTVFLNRVRYPAELVSSWHAKLNADGFVTEVNIEADWPSRKPGDS